MQLDCDGGMPGFPATAASTAHHGGVAAQSDMPVKSSTAPSEDTVKNTSTAVTDEQASVKAAGAASRILDELLGDMLTILEDSEVESDDDDGKSVTSSSSAASSEPEEAGKLPSKAISPIQSEKEEGELESEEETRLAEERQSQARLQAEQKEASRLARGERRKKSIENNISERDVFKYLKKRGE